MIVVSGMARGIDSEGHRGILDGGGKTIAVLGCGVDICYPAENKELMERIIENGCVISDIRPECLRLLRISRTETHHCGN